MKEARYGYETKVQKNFDEAVAWVKRCPNPHPGAHPHSNTNSHLFAIILTCDAPEL